MIRKLLHVLALPFTYERRVRREPQGEGPTLRVGNSYLVRGRRWVHGRRDGA